MATRPFQFMDMEERHTPESELLRHNSFDWVVGTVRRALKVFGYVNVPAEWRLRRCLGMT